MQAALRARAERTTAARPPSDLPFRERPVFERPPRSHAARRRVALPALWLTLSLASTPVLPLAPVALAGEGDPRARGAYCPLPPEGQPMVCHTPAQQEFEEFFDALGRHAVDAQASARVEGALREGSASAVLALSSLTFGYYTTMRHAAQAGELPQEVADQLERWSQLVAIAYAAHADKPTLREALQLAAIDLHEHAGADSDLCATVALPACRDTTAMLASMGLLDDPHALSGIRGGLTRLMMRLRGGGAREEAE